MYYTGKQSRIKGFWATEAHSSCAFFVDYVFYFIIPKILFSGIPAGTEETPVQSGHSGVCEIVTGLFLWAKKSRYKKSSLLQSGRMKNVIETVILFMSAPQLFQNTSVFNFIHKCIQYNYHCVYPS